METQRHCLWDCQDAQQIWRRVGRLFAHRADMTLSWGAAAWSTTFGPALAYEIEPDSLVLRLGTGGFSPADGQIERSLLHQQRLARDGS